ncbi:MAG: hypothetical protein ABIJ09_23995 [Pseudomonadota bacterium]
MKIDDMMLRFRVQAEREAIDRGEPPLQTPPITFDTVQELIQKGQLSSSEAALLDHLLEQIEQVHPEQAGSGAAEARSRREAQIAGLRAQLSEIRVRGAEQATPEDKLRDYAPGPPTPMQEEGPVLPLHGSLLGKRLPGGPGDEEKG